MLIELKTAHGVWELLGKAGSIAQHNLGKAESRLNLRSQKRGEGSEGLLLAGR